MSIRDITPNPMSMHGSSNNTWDIIGLVVIASALIIVFVALGYLVFVDAPETKVVIENLSCGELKEYIADKERFWGIAEHRYIWTCEK